MPEDAPETTRAYIERRAKESNVSDDKLWLDPEFHSDGRLLGRDGVTPEPTDHAHLISGIFDGALDFEEYTAGMYEVNIADWIVELYNASYDPDKHECGFDVIVTEYNYGEPGDLVYRVSRG